MNVSAGESYLQQCELCYVRLIAVLCVCVSVRGLDSLLLSVFVMNKCSQLFKFIILTIIYMYFITHNCSTVDAA